MGIKKCIKIVFVIFSVIILSSVFIIGENKIKLTCNQSGDFTILVVSDPQCDTEGQWQEARAELETLVQRANPDFVLINGDMNSKNQIPSDMWDEFISPLTKRKIYWSTTNGNHDLFRYEYYLMYKKYDTCLNSIVSITDQNFDFTRPMNYCLPIYSNNGKKIVFAVYGMDSGQSNSNGYEGLNQKQIDWYLEQSNNLKAQNEGKSVTSVLCMHLPIPQTVDMYYSINENGDKLYKVYGVANEPKHSKRVYICENGTCVTNLKIHTSSKEQDHQVFEIIKKQNDIKAIIFGHDHCTNILGSYKGVLLGFAGKLSTGCYSDTLCRGGRVIRFNQQNPEKFTTEWLGTLDTSKDQPQVYSDGTLKEKW